MRLGPGVNTSAYEADVFVAPDGSYLIFTAGRRGGLGHGALYISFHGEDGTFEKAKSLGAPINTEGHEICPLFPATVDLFITPIDRTSIASTQPHSGHIADRQQERSLSHPWLSRQTFGFHKQLVKQATSGILQRRTEETGCSQR